MIFFALIIKCAPCHPDGSKQRENLRKKKNPTTAHSRLRYIVFDFLFFVRFLYVTSTFYTRYCFCNWIAALMKCITAALQVEKYIYRLLENLVQI